MVPRHPCQEGPTVADLDAAFQAANDCVEADYFARSLFNSSKKEASAELFGFVERGIQILTEAVAYLPLLERVEHYLAGGVATRVQGVGCAASAHRLAFQLTLRTRSAIWDGWGDAISDEALPLMAQVIELKASGRKVASKLAREEEEARGRFNAWAMRTKNPDTAADIGACWRPHTWEAIRNKLGDDREIDYVGLGVAIHSEHLRGRRLIALSPPAPPQNRVRFDPNAGAIILDGVSYLVTDPDVFKAFKVLYEETSRDGGRILNSEKHRALLGNCHHDNTLQRRLDRLPPELRDCIGSQRGKGRWVRLPPLSEG